MSEGSFVPDREHDILTKALGNPEHPGRTRGKDSKVPWKTGFPQDAHRYKFRRNTEQKRIDQLKAAFEETYEEKKRKEREEQETLGTPPVPSSAGSVDQAEPFGMFPVDSITGPNRCKLYVPVGKVAFKIEVASGMAYPERLWHGNPAPPAYIRVTADMVYANTMDCKLYSQQPIQRSTLSEGPRTSSFSGLDETLPWKDMYEFRYNSLNLYRSNMTLNLWNLNYPLLLLLRHHNLHVRVLLQKNVHQVLLHPLGLLLQLVR